MCIELAGGPVSPTVQCALPLLCTAMTMAAASTTTRIPRLTPTPIPTKVAELEGVCAGPLVDAGAKGP